MISAYIENNIFYINVTHEACKSININETSILQEAIDSYFNNQANNTKDKVLGFNDTSKDSCFKIVLNITNSVLDIYPIVHLLSGVLTILPSYLLTTKRSHLFTSIETEILINIEDSILTYITPAIALLEYADILKYNYTFNICKSTVCSLTGYNEVPFVFNLIDSDLYIAVGVSTQNIPDTDKCARQFDVPDMYCFFMDTDNNDTDDTSVKSQISICEYLGLKSIKSTNSFAMCVDTELNPVQISLDNQSNLLLYEINDLIWTQSQYSSDILDKKKSEIFKYISDRSMENDLIIFSQSTVLDSDNNYVVKSEATSVSVLNTLQLQTNMNTLQLNVTPSKFDIQQKLKRILLLKDLSTYFREFCKLTDVTRRYSSFYIDCNVGLLNAFVDYYLTRIITNTLYDNQTRKYSYITVVEEATLNMEKDKSSTSADLCMLLTILKSTHRVRIEHLKLDILNVPIPYSHIFTNMFKTCTKNVFLFYKCDIKEIHIGEFSVLSNSGCIRFIDCESHITIYSGTPQYITTNTPIHVLVKNEGWLVLLNEDCLSMHSDIDYIPCSNILAIPPQILQLPCTLQ